MIIEQLHEVVGIVQVDAHTHDSGTKTASASIHGVQSIHCKTRTVRGEGGPFKVVTIKVETAEGWADINLFLEQE